MSIVTGNVKFGVNYPVYVITNQPITYDVPDYKYNYLLLNTTTSGTNNINLPPISSVPNGWTLTIATFNSALIVINANGSDLINDSSNLSQNIILSHNFKFIANHSSTGNTWVII